MQKIREIVQEMNFLEAPKVFPYYLGSLVFTGVSAPARGRLYGKIADSVGPRERPWTSAQDTQGVLVNTIKKRKDGSTF